GIVGSLMQGFNWLRIRIQGEPMSDMTEYGTTPYRPITMGHSASNSSAPAAPAATSLLPLHPLLLPPPYRLLPPQRRLPKEGRNESGSANQ
ncbi:MAG: hypothetical protein KDE50_02455, partial [Caldilineaceae bacterium]|nr:hypothetical protein [Caldilineaceae bacterium]